MIRLITLFILLSLIAGTGLAPHLCASPIGPPQRRAGSLRLVPNRISLTSFRSGSGRSFDLNLPQGFAISVAVQGLKRVRFMAASPDRRIFVTDMYNLADNQKGAVYILDDFDAVTRTFKSVKPYLTGLRNPNSVAFFTDEQGVHWFYLALTDHLLRYKYHRGENSPTSSPEVIATFPDYGLSYKYGGWHLTRTITVGGNRKLYVSVGSSCNACEEKEKVRASILEMDPDGRNLRTFARGLRNAVGLRWVNDRLFATNMGSDHLGDHKPADTMYQVQNNVNYGWPYCFQSGPGRFPDVKFNPGGRKMNCRQVPPAYAAFDAPSSPLGPEHFDANYGEALANSFLVALHGATKESIKRGYRVVRLGPGRARNDPPEDFING